MIIQATLPDYDSDDIYWEDEDGKRYRLCGEPCQEKDPEGLTMADLGNHVVEPEAPEEDNCTCMDIPCSCPLGSQLEDFEEAPESKEGAPEKHKIHDCIMGCSQWREMGKKRGYWDYFRKEVIMKECAAELSSAKEQAREEERERILSAIKQTVHGDKVHPECATKILECVAKLLKILK